MTEAEKIQALICYRLEQAARQTETSRHSGAIAQFDQVYAKPGLLRKEFSRWLHEAFLRRQSVTTARKGTSPLSRDEIDTLLAHAREFLAGVRQYLEAHPPPGT